MSASWYLLGSFSVPKLNPKAVTSHCLALPCKHDPCGPEVLSLSSQGHKGLIGFFHFPSALSKQITMGESFSIPFKIHCYVLH